VKPFIGIIGGIGSGKSLVAEELRGRGGFLINADAFGHEALRQPEIKRAVSARFGADILDERGEIVRKKLGAIVFAGPEERRALEALVFPFIEARILDEMARGERDPAAKFIVLDAAVMLEAGWSGRCDKVLFVEAPRSARLERLRRQRGWTDAQLQAREAAQMPLEEKKRRSDAVLDNSGDPVELRRRLDELLRAWRLA
jgi:dephospho-CoA kinase